MIQKSKRTWKCLKNNYQTTMREYRIIRTDLGYNIYKKLEKNWYVSLRFLGSNNKWVLNKDAAKIFYHREDAVSNLVIVKHRDEHKGTD